MKLKRFFDRPILSSLVIMVIAVLSMLVIALPINALLNAVFGASDEIVAAMGADVNYVAALTVGKALSGFLILLFVKRCIDKDYRFFCRKENFFKGMGYMWLMAVETAATAIYMLSSGGTLYKSPLIILGVLFMLATGINEEAFFRAAILPNVLRVWKDKKDKYLMAVLISGVPFGILHLVNIPKQGVFPTLSQVFFAAGGGMLFAAAYLRTGNLMSCVVMHSIVDMTGGIIDCDTETLSNSAVNYIGSATFGIALIIAALYLIRPAKHNEIDRNFIAMGDE